MISLSGYLRPSEVLGLRKKDVIKPVRGVSSYWTLLMFPEEELRRSKTGTYDDSVSLDSEYLQSFIDVWLVALTKGRAAGPLWSFDYATMLNEFQKSRDRLGLRELAPYQLRHSGVSEDLNRRVRTFAEAQRRGKWRSMKSMMRYEKHARLQATASKYSEKLNQYLDLAERHFEDVMLGRPHPVILAPLA